MSRGAAVLAAVLAATALIAIGLLSVGSGKSVKPITYDPPPEPSAGRWSTWVIGNPASVRVPPLRARGR